MYTNKNKKMFPRYLCHAIDNPLPECVYTIEEEITHYAIERRCFIPNNKSFILKETLILK